MFKERRIGLQFHVVDADDEAFQLRAPAGGKQRDRGALNRGVANSLNLIGRQIGNQPDSPRRVQVDMAAKTSSEIEAVQSSEINSEAAHQDVDAGHVSSLGLRELADVAL